ncbi:hypothetical protein [Fictibacillus fluitans]|uniref:Uncharacterized protein n=1 Tax=Fictibacillus fluitans TaxID=3058422 RepID=A0ABT8HVF8_9BACL|nr:hypothetical protein [Fictibacillus sp. NE201]MDN4524480.1 hypothetical protein [Fictibacillus sp. NE201]
MNNWLQQAVSWTEQRLGQASEGFREIFNKIKQESSMSVDDLATFIMLHPETIKNRRELLGLTFATYRLKMGETDLVLEAKENSMPNILECMVMERNQVVSHYRSYDKKNKKIMAVPDDIKNYHSR